MASMSWGDATACEVLEHMQIPRTHTYSLNKMPLMTNMEKAPTMSATMPEAVPEVWRNARGHMDRVLRQALA